MKAQFGWPMYLSNSPEPAHALQFSDAKRWRRDVAPGGVRLCEAGIVPNMLVHDAILLEADTEEQIFQAAEIMKQAGT